MCSAADSDDAYSEDDSGDELPNVADTIARVKKVQKNPDISATPRNPARMKKGTGLIKARHNVLANSSNALSVVAPVKGTPRAKSKRGGRKRTLKDPNAPKKPLTAYFCFLRRARAQQAEEKSRAKSTKELSEAWKKLSDDEKKSLSAEADIEKARYRSERKQYEDSGAKARWEAQHPPQIYKNVAKKVKKREMRDPDRPKRSASAFFLFCAAKREESRAESSKAPTVSYCANIAIGAHKSRLYTPRNRPRSWESFGLLSPKRKSLHLRAGQKQERNPTKRLLKSTPRVVPKLDGTLTSRLSRTSRALMRRGKKSRLRRKAH